MTGPKVSIITPCYQAAKFLPATIECALGQTYGNIQYILVNDGSDDDTDAVVAPYTDRLCYLRQPNAGQAAARNRALYEHADGRYVLFLDADDLLHPEAVAWLVEAAQERDDVLCIVGLRLFEHTPFDGTKEFLPPAITALLPWFLRENFGPPHCFLAARAMVAAVGGFDRTFPGCEDWDLWVRLALAGAGVATVPRVGAYYRRHAGSYSTTTVKMVAGRVMVWQRLCAEALRRPELLAQHGADLLQKGHEIRRRCIAQKIDAEQVTALSQGIRQLEKAGLCLRKSWLRRLLEGMLGGGAADRLTMAYFRLCEPRLFAYYKEGYM